MNPLIKKEVRLLLPAWVVALLLAVFPCWIVEHFMPGQRIVDDFSPQYFIVFGVLLLCVSSLGQEMAYKTFSLQMAQPVSRNRVWRTKLLMLAAALFSTFAAAVISWNIFVLRYPGYQTHFFDHFRDLPLWTLIYFSGGLWTTLLLRQVVGAFWITFLAPLAIFIGFNFLAGFLGLTGNLDWILFFIFLIYSVAGFVFARQLFFRAQDTQWTGGNVLFPWRRATAEQTGSRLFSRLRNRYLVLIWKEIQLQEVNLFIAVVLLVLHLAALPLRMVVSNANLKMALDFIWALWLLMPLLIGSAAVAEERRLGTLDSQLCLPVSRSRQFSIKFFVGLALSLVLGALAPTLIERTRDFGTKWFDDWIFVSALSVFFISFYASTLARAILQAIGIAMSIPVVACSGILLFCALAFDVELNFSNANLGYRYASYENLGRAFLMICLAVPVFGLVLARLMFWNFAWLHENFRLWQRNLAALLISFACVYALTGVIFYRSWGWLAPIDTPHGPARLTMETRAKVMPDWGRMVAVLPDGRLWQEDIGETEYYFNAFGWLKDFPLLSTSRFIGGSYWSDASANYLFILGIHSDGSLWSVPCNSFKASRVGGDTNWLGLARDNNGFLLLKKDGTLWLWGTNEVPDLPNESARLSQKIKKDLASTPVRISNETNWVNISSFAFNQALVKKSDGSLWLWNQQYNGTNLVRRWMQLKDMERWESYYPGGNNMSVAVSTNGELWLLYDLPENQTWYTAYRQKVHLCPGSKWEAANTSYGYVIAIRSDGTLWKGFLENLVNHPDSMKQQGNQSDWVALSQYWPSTALAADGSLWAWGQPSDRVWLAPSRRPVYFGNVFQGTK